MKIIEEPTDFAEKNYRVRCRKCETVFKFKGKEAIECKCSRWLQIGYTGLTKDTDDFIHIGCPTCQTRWEVRK